MTLVEKDPGLSKDYFLQEKLETPPLMHMAFPHVSGLISMYGRLAPLPMVITGDMIISLSRGVVAVEMRVNVQE